VGDTEIDHLWIWLGRMTRTSADLRHRIDDGMARLIRNCQILVRVWINLGEKLRACLRNRGQHVKAGKQARMLRVIGVNGSILWVCQCPHHQSQSTRRQLESSRESLESINTVCVTNHGDLISACVRTRANLRTHARTHACTTFEGVTTYGEMIVVTAMCRSPGKTVTHNFTPCTFICYMH